MKKEKNLEYQIKKARRIMRVKEAFCVIFAVAALCALFFCAYYFSDTKRPLYDDISVYVKEAYARPVTDVDELDFFASGLCVSGSDKVSLEGYDDPDETLTASALFDINEAKVLQGFNLYGPIFPASTTKLLTAYVALKHADIDETVTAGRDVTDFPWDAQVCGLKEKDQISMYDLLCGLLISSGNDCARAIADHICGSEKAFADLMNKEAFQIGATGTHFVNPHGLHSDGHYTTAYDLYLIFRECMKFPKFSEIIAMKEYTAHIKDKDGKERTPVWRSTNFYADGKEKLPEGLTGLGGKTGFTHEAGRCLVYLSKDARGDTYISVVMGADSQEILYDRTDSLLSAGLSAKGGL